MWRLHTTVGCILTNVQCGLVLSCHSLPCSISFQPGTVPFVVSSEIPNRRTGSESQAASDELRTHQQLFASARRDGHSQSDAERLKNPWADKVGSTFTWTNATLASAKRRGKRLVSCILFPFPGRYKSCDRSCFQVGIWATG